MNTRPRYVGILTSAGTDGSAGRIGPGDHELVVSVLRSLRPPTLASLLAVPS